MDSKKVLQKLLKIAENQQKIIMKLAQAQQGLPPDSLPNSQVSVTDNQKPAPPTDTPPADLRANKPIYAPNKFVFDAMNVDSRTRGMLRHINPPVNNQLMVIFNPGKNTDANWTTINTVFTELKNRYAGLNKDLQLQSASA